MCTLAKSLATFGERTSSAWSTVNLLGSTNCGNFRPIFRKILYGLIVDLPSVEIYNN